MLNFPSAMNASLERNPAPSQGGVLQSGSGFRDAFSKIMGAPPSKSESCKALKACWIDTPLGPMLAVTDDEALCLLEFVDRRGLEKEIERLDRAQSRSFRGGLAELTMQSGAAERPPLGEEESPPSQGGVLQRLRKKTKLPIIPGRSSPAQQIEKELGAYFAGIIQEFKTPLLLMGSPFQKKVWEELQKIPSGETRSYAEMAKTIGKPSAFRAVALANGANQIAIVIPCHRVINSNGNLGGYSGGIKRKEWLLKHEKK